MPLSVEDTRLLEAIRPRINSAVVEGLKNKIRTTFKRSHVFNAQEYKDIPFLKGMNSANPLRIKRPERDLDPCHRLDRPV